MERFGVLWVRFSVHTLRRCINRRHSGHCYLMQDDLQKAYSAYQHALYSLPNPKVCVRVPH